ncbi:MAG: BF3164 family lipoprotein [Bacteroidales bacterium]
MTGNLLHDSVYAADLQPLTPGEAAVDEDSFGEVVELEGISVPVDEVFKVRETQLLVRDSFLIIKNRMADHHFMVYSLPDLRLIQSMGKAGRGPKEFQFPRLIRSHHENMLCYIFEMTQNKLYAVNRELEIIDMGIALPESSGSMFSSKQIESLNDSAFVFVESVSKGKEVFHLHLDSTIAHVTPIHNLSFNENIRNWAAYTGDFGVNPNKHRMVYAYKYFRRLVFTDTESLKSKTVIFDEQRGKGPDLSDVLGPHNTSYYWGLSAQNNYVYLLYSGRRPLEVHEQQRKSPGYIFLEQFDWNGNPVRKFKLDRWGYFCVSEDENTIYLVSTNDEHPIYKYTLPDI